MHTYHIHTTHILKHTHTLLPHTNKNDTSQHRTTPSTTKTIHTPFTFASLRRHRQHRSTLHVSFLRLLCQYHFTLILGMQLVHRFRSFMSETLHDIHVFLSSFRLNGMIRLISAVFEVARPYNTNKPGQSFVNTKVLNLSKILTPVDMLRVLYPILCVESYIHVL